MSRTSAPKRKPAYDPARQWGLKPVDGDSGGSTYVISGHVVNGSKWESPSAIEGIGREGQAKAKRKISTKDADRTLMNLLKRDKEGMRVVMKAREVGQRGVVDGGAKKGVSNCKADGKFEKRTVVVDGEAEELWAAKVIPTKAGYSAEVIKRLGFDPIGQARIRTDSDTQKKVCADIGLDGRLDVDSAAPLARLAGSCSVRPQKDRSWSDRRAKDSLGCQIGRHVSQRKK